MLKLAFKLKNPFPQSLDNEKPGHDYVCKSWMITENKFLEVQITRWGILDTIIDFSFEIGFTGEDHAGSEFCLTLFNYYFGIQFRDKRHWNYDKNQWEE